jgi:catechol 2,3-dioxygenase-like lactoylglutathione lyase family enzyme
MIPAVPRRPGRSRHAAVAAGSTFHFFLSERELSRMKISLLCALSLSLSLGWFVLARGDDASHAPDSGRVKLAFNHLALSVQDVDRSADFYGRVLGLAEIPRSAKGSKGVRWFSLGNGQQLHLISPVYYRGDAVHINKAVHLALATDHFDDFLKQLSADGIAWGNWAGEPKKFNTRTDEVKQIYFQDPDGYWIEVNSAGEK